MKYILVLSMTADSPEDISNAIKKIDPPSIPGFSGAVRIALESTATTIEEWLDG